VNTRCGTVPIVDTLKLDMIGYVLNVDGKKVMKTSPAMFQELGLREYVKSDD